MKNIFQNKKRTSKLLDERGIAMPLVLTVVSLLTIMGFGVLSVAKNNNNLTVRGERTVKAMHIAESGIDNYLWHLNEDGEYYVNYVHSAQGQDGQGNDRWVDFQGGQYHLEVTALPAETPGAIVESTGRIPNGSNGYITRTIRARIVKKSFVNYLYLTDHEIVEGSGSLIWFITGDVIHGPLHSNDVINIYGNPVFEKKVTTSRTLNIRSGSNPQFQEGYEENASPLEFPPANIKLKEFAQIDGYYYYGTTTITLNLNGSLNIVNNDTSGRTEGPTGTVSLPSNGVIYVDGQTGSKGNSTNGDIYISGTLSGNLTVASKNNIYITGDILYADDNEDMLGLVADNYVYIQHWRNWRDVDVAPYNIEINAAIFALNHSFTFEDYSRGPAKGTLTIEGSISQRYRGPIGTFSGSTRVSGYLKSYWYDEQMKYQQPPHFIEPVNSGYEIGFWEEIKR